MRLAAIVATLAMGGAGGWQCAAAAELGLYASVHYGQARKDALQAPFDDFSRLVYGDFGFTPLESSTRFDTKDRGYGFAFGYRLLRNFALEGGFMDLGAIKYRDVSTGTSEEGPLQTWRQNLDSSTRGITVSALGVLPVAYRWELYARGGVVFSSNEFEIFITDGERRGRSRVTSSGIDLLAGAGVSFEFAEIYAARLEFQRVFAAGERETGPEVDVDLVTFGFTVYF